MGGPFRAIVGGAQQTMSFAPAQAIKLDNYSDQYGHLVKSDIFVAPGQIGLVELVNGITAEIFKFEAPPNATQAAATPGQICLIRTYDEAAGPGAPPPLTPGVGVLLPIGLDSPQHFHNHSHGSHFHSHAHGSHNHAHSGTHLHGHSATHTHTTGNHSHTQMWGLSNTGPATAGTAHTHQYNDPNNFGSAGTETGQTLNSSAGTGASAPGNTDSSSPGNTDLASVNADATPTTPAADTTLENVRHTHP